MAHFAPTQLSTATDLQAKIVPLQSDLAAILGREVEATPVVPPARKKDGRSAAGRADQAENSKELHKRVGVQSGKTLV